MLAKTDTYSEQHDQADATVHSIWARFATRPYGRFHIKLYDFSIQTDKKILVNEPDNVVYTKIRKEGGDRYSKRYIRKQKT